MRDRSEFNAWFRHAVRGLPQAADMRRKGHQTANVTPPFGAYHDNLSYARDTSLVFDLKIERLEGSGQEVGVWRFCDLIVRTDVL